MSHELEYSQGYQACADIIKGIFDVASKMETSQEKHPRNLTVTYVGIDGSPLRGGGHFKISYEAPTLFAKWCQNRLEGLIPRQYQERKITHSSVYVNCSTIGIVARRGAASVEHTISGVNLTELQNMLRFLKTTVEDQASAQKKPSVLIRMTP